MPSISRISSAERCCSGRLPTSATSWRRSSRRWASSTGSCSGLRETSKSSGGGGGGPRGGGRDRPAQVVDAAVVGHAVQPGAHVHLAVVVAQRPVGPHEHVLEHVLGVLARGRREHLAHGGAQPLPIAVVQHAEGFVVSVTEQRHQLLVRAQPQQRTAERQATQCCWGVYR